MPTPLCCRTSGVWVSPERSRCHQVWALVALIFSLGSLLLGSTPAWSAIVADPSKDADSPGVDLVRASFELESDGNLTIEVRFAPGTYDPETDHTWIEIDTDQNPSTGDGGTEVLVGKDPDSRDFVFHYPGGLNYSIPDATEIPDGFRIRLQPADFKNDDGRFDVYVETSRFNGSHLTRTDRMPDVGYARLTVTTVSSISVSGPSSGTVGQKLDYSAAASGCSPEPAGWSWHFGDGSSSQGNNTASTFYRVPGTFTISVHNTACGSAAGTKVVTITPLASAPVITIEGPQTGVTLEIMEFSASATGCTPSSQGWSWQLGGGTAVVPSTGSSQATFWLFPGTKTVEVRNSACGSAKGTRVVTVASPNEAYLLISADGKIKRNRPTIVFTHGLQPKGFARSELWSCIKPSQGCDEEKLDWWPGKLLANRKELNVLQFVWRQAGQGLPTRLSYANARQWAPAAGEALADLLISNLGEKYTGTVHFVGHSLGTVVNARAAARFLMRATKAGTVQITVLDRPDHVNVLGAPLSCLSSWDPVWCGDGFEGVYGYSRTFLPTQLGGVARRKAGLRLDNYYSKPLGSSSAGVGDETAGIPGAKVYNHRRPRPGDSSSCPDCPARWSDGLRDPNDVGGSYFEDENWALILDNDHTGVHQWYRLTIDPNRVAPGICNDRVFFKPFFWHGSLNPCRQGWYWALNGPDSSAFPTTQQAQFVAQRSGVALTDAESFLRCGGEGATACAASWEVSHPVRAEVVPETAGFEVTVDVLDGAEGDLIVLLIDDRVHEIRSVKPDRKAESITLGPISMTEEVSEVQLQVVVTGPSPGSTTRARVRSVQTIVGSMTRPR